MDMRINESISSRAAGKRKRTCNIEKSSGISLSLSLSIPRPAKRKECAYDKHAIIARLAVIKPNTDLSARRRVHDISILYVC